MIWKGQISFNWGGWYVIKKFFWRITNSPFKAFNLGLKWKSYDPPKWWDWNLAFAPLIHLNIISMKNYKIYYEEGDSSSQLSVVMSLLSLGCHFHFISNGLQSNIGSNYWKIIIYNLLKYK